MTVAPQPTAAALSLALPRHDYPHGSRITQLPATNAVADTYFGPAHRTAFDRLGRIDGEGWVQAALWHFRTGRGAAVRSHRTVYAYGIHVFRGARGALRALKDVKLRTYASRVAHLWTRRFQSSDVHTTLVFDFFAVGPVEVEAYYQYSGVAPTSLAASFHHTFSTQTSHLVALARRYSKALRAHPTPVPTSTPVPTETPTPLPTDTPTAVSTATPTPPPTATSIPTATPTSTSTPTPTPTATPAGIVIVAQPGATFYSPGDLATISAQVTDNGVPVANAIVSVHVLFPGADATCTTHSDASGMGSCSVPVPDEQSGIHIPVQVQVTLPAGGIALASTQFTVK